MKQILVPNLNNCQEIKRIRNENFIPHYNGRNQTERNTHWCSSVDFCFTDLNDTNKKVSTNSIHIHYYKNIVSIGRGPTLEYVISKLEFILFFSELMKKLEKLKEKFNG